MTARRNISNYSELYGLDQYNKYRNWESVSRMETLESERNYYRDYNEKLIEYLGKFIAATIDWGEKLNMDMRTRGEPSDVELDLLHKLQHEWPNSLSKMEMLAKCPFTLDTELGDNLLSSPNVYHTCQSTAEAVDATGI